MSGGQARPRDWREEEEKGQRTQAECRPWQVQAGSVGSMGARLKVRAPTPAGSQMVDWPQGILPAHARLQQDWRTVSQAGGLRDASGPGVDPALSPVQVRPCEQSWAVVEVQSPGPGRPRGWWAPKAEPQALSPDVCGLRSQLCRGPGRGLQWLGVAEGNPWTQLCFQRTP